MRLRAILHTCAVVAATAIAGWSLTACKEESTLERAGEKADEAVRDGKRSVEDATD